MALNSHFGVANKKFTELQPQALVEELYTQKSDSTLRSDVFDKLTEFMNTCPYNAAQETFDSTDVPLLLKSAGCTFDFDPDDRG